jgi:hypothetical protein
MRKAHSAREIVKRRIVCRLHLSAVMQAIRQYAEEGEFDEKVT